MKTPLILKVQGIPISIIKTQNNEYISLTDIAKYKNSKDPKDVVKNWMRLKNSIEFLGLREIINNPLFKRVEFDSFKKESGSNSFTLSPQKWIYSTNAIGIISKLGRYGSGSFAHKDIAIKFASWISAEFELYLIKEFQRLKYLENSYLDRDIKRFLTKINYKIHTDAIKNNIIPKRLLDKEIHLFYADEADVLNKALFGLTAKERRDQNPKKTGNMRDYATIEQLIILANIESINAQFIAMGISQEKRILLLNQTAITQMNSLCFTRNHDLKNPV